MGIAAVLAVAAAVQAPAIAGQQSTPATAERSASSSRATLIDYLDRTAAHDLAERRATVAAIGTKEAVAARLAKVRETLTGLLGGLDTSHPPLNARVTGRIAGDGYRVESLVFDGAPDEHITANLFLPANSTGKHPAIILSPGHGPNGKASDYAFAANFARNGFIALTWDIMGEGERKEYYDPETGRSRAERPTGDHSVAAYQSLLTGTPIATRFLHDAMRGVDYLQSRSEVDPARIGAFGCSGGGTMTAYLGALDDRVKAVGVACYVNDFDHLFASIGPQDAEQSIPGFVAAGLDIPDWVELAAPKPYAVISTTEDMFPFAGATVAVNEAKRFWQIEGAADRFTWITGPGPHGAIVPLADKIIAFFRSGLSPAAPVAAFVPLRPAHPQDLNATATGQVSTSIRGATMATLAADQAARVAPQTRPTADALRADVRRLAGIDDTIPIVTDDAAGGVLHIAAPAGWLDATIVAPVGKPTRAVLLLASDAAAHKRAQALTAGGAIVVLLPPRGADGDEELKASIVGNQNLLGLRAMLVGRTLSGLRIEDALGVIDWLHAHAAVPITVEGYGETGPVALQAALLDPNAAAVRIVDSQLSLRAAVDRPMQRELPPIAIPGMLTAYDLPDVIAALAPRPIEIVAPIDPVGEPLKQADYRTFIGATLANDPRIRFADYPSAP